MIHPEVASEAPEPRGLKWTIIASFGKNLLQLASTLLLARFLNPGEFGIGSIITVLYFGFSIATEFGTSTAIIQSKEAGQAFLSTIFWFNLLLGFCSSLFLFVTAPLWAGFFHEPVTEPLIRTFSLVCIFFSIGIVPQAILARSLQFRTLARIDLAGAVFSLTIGLFSAISGSGAWCFVHQYLAFAFINSLLWGVSSRWTPTKHFQARELWELRSFIAHLLGYYFTYFLFRNADSLIIAHFLSMKDLGYYQVAQRIVLLPIQKMSQILGQILFPLLSRVKDDHDAFRSTIITAGKTTALFSFPLMLGISVMNESFVQVFFGKAWEPLVPLIRIFCPVGLFFSFATMAGPVFQAKGRTDLLFKWGAASGILNVIALFWGSRFGLNGVALFFLATNILLLYPGFKIPFSLIDLRVSTFAGALKIPFGLSLVMSFALLVLQHSGIIPWPSETFLLIASVSMGVGLYFFLTRYFNRKALSSFLKMVST